MKLPIIRSMVEFQIEKQDDSVEKAIHVIEHISQARGWKDEELDIIGEILSNLYGAQEVSQAVSQGPAPARSPKWFYATSFRFN